MRMDFDAIKKAALAQSQRLVPEWLPGGKFSGHTYTAINPTRADKGLGSFKINLRTGQWADFATNDKGGDLISLYAYLRGIDWVEAALFLARQLDVTVMGTPTTPEEAFKPRGEWVPVLPVPDDAGQAPAHYNLGPPTSTWTYRNAEGRELGRVCRFDKPGGGKAVLPLTFCEDINGNRDWRFKAFEAPRPLYGLDRLAANPDAPVLLVEGEKSADAAQALFEDYVVMTSPSGSKAAGKADWTPLKGRTVVIWPDADEPGLGYADDVADLLHQARAASVAVVEVPGSFPKGWDLADDLPEGFNTESLAGLLAGAPVWEPDVNDPEDASAVFPRPTRCPVDVLPQVYRDAVQEIATEIDSPIEFPFVTLLVAAGACIGQTRALSAKSRYNVHPNLYAAIIAESGTGKSPAMTAVVDPLRKIEGEWYREFKEQMRDHERELEQIAAMPKDQRPTEKPELPVKRELTLDDATPEAVSDVLAANPRGVLWLTDELVGMLTGLDKYAGKQGSSRNRLLSAWDSGPWKVRRSSNPDRDLHIDKATLSILGSIQPERLGDAFSKSDRHSGLLPRFLFVQVSINHPPTWTEERNTEETVALLDTLWRSLLSLDFLVDENEDPHTQVVGISSDAKELYVGWWEKVRSWPWRDTQAEPYRALPPKIVNVALRLALILHCLEAVAESKSELREVRHTTMVKALALADWFFAHQLQIWSRMEREVPEPGLLPKRVARAIVELEDEIEKGRLPVSRVTEQVNQGQDPRFHVEPQAVGIACRKLGLAGRSNGKRRLIEVTDKKISDLRAEYSPPDQEPPMEFKVLEDQVSEPGEGGAGQLEMWDGPSEVEI